MRNILPENYSKILKQLNCKKLPYKWLSLRELYIGSLACSVMQSKVKFGLEYTLWCYLILCLYTFLKSAYWPWLNYLIW